LVILIRLDIAGTDYAELLVRFVELPFFDPVVV